jgi:hypothetical protein
MTGQRDLRQLLANLSPTLDQCPYEFVLREKSPLGDAIESSFALIREEEGFTVVHRMAEYLVDDEPATDCFARITLGVHSSLHAIGLTAAVSQALASEYISCNVIAGLYHDHIFVPWPRRMDALAAIEALSVL